MNDIVEEIKAVANYHGTFTWKPQHPQYIDGTLYLTQKQVDTIPKALPTIYGPNPQHIWGIPVIILKPGEWHNLKNGHRITYSETLKCIIIVNAHDAFLKSYFLIRDTTPETPAQ